MKRKEMRIYRRILRLLARGSLSSHSFLLCMLEMGHQRGVGSFCIGEDEQAGSWDMSLLDGIRANG